MDMQELELSVSPEEMCRTCLAAFDRAQLKPIFCSEILDGRIVPFPKVVELSTGEKFIKDEKLPNNVCIECKAKLRELFTFVEKVRKSSILLYEIFSIAKPELTQGAEKNIETRNVETQTCTATIESGTQCGENRSTPVTFAEAACQTDDFAEKNETQINCLNNVDVAYMEHEQISSVAVKNESSTAPITIEIEQTHCIEDDVTLANDEDEFEMILVAEEPNEEECYELQTVNSDEKHTNSLPIIEVNSKRMCENIVANETDRSKLEQNQKCEYCNFSGRLETLENHFQIHRQSLELCFESMDYYRCSICFSVFISQTQFDAHYNESCQPVLPEDYIEHSDLHKHQTVYRKGLDECVPKLKTLKRIKEHDRYRCGRCTKHTNSFEEMRIHSHCHDAGDEKMDVDLLWKKNSFDKVHVCGLCNSQFPDALYIRQHLYFHQSSFFCPYDCTIIFGKFLNLTRHIHRVHLQDSKVGSSSQDTRHPCERCGRCFSNADTLQTHMKKHYRERKYVCNVCRKYFAQKSDLTTHNRIHTDERPYTCEICSKTFRTTSHRRDHMSTHEAVNKYECDVCQKLFKAERILAGHKRLHTGEKPYQCDVCTKAFSRKHHLKLHIKTHLKQTTVKAIT